MLGHGRISHFSACTLSIYSTLIAIVLRGYDAAHLYAIVDFYLFYDRVVDILI